MMEEKVIKQSCRFCENRKWTPEQGVFCGLTGMKLRPNVDCNDFKLDEEEHKKYAERLQNKDDSVSGWLFFFLWFGLIGGASMTVIKTLVNSIREGNSVVVAIVFSLLCTAPFVYIAIRAVRGFYKKANYAFSAAMTYIILIICDAIANVIISFLAKESSVLPQIFRSIVWASIWMTYLFKSEKVSRIVPPDTRVWTWKEFVTIIFYVVICSIVVLFVYLSTIL